MPRTIDKTLSSLVNINQRADMFYIIHVLFFIAILYGTLKCRHQIQSTQHFSKDLLMGK